MDRQIVTRETDVLDLYDTTPIDNLIKDLTALKDAGWTDIRLTGCSEPNYVVLRLETDTEFYNRVLAEGRNADIEKEKRRKQYLALKEEFGE